MEIKKVIQTTALLLVAVALSQTAIAKSSKHNYKNYKAEPCSVSPFDGGFFGAGLGANTLLSQSTVHFTTISATDPNDIFFDGSQQITSLDTNDVYNYAVMGDIYMGFGKVLPYGIYAGALVGLNFYDADKTRMKDNDATISNQGFPVIEHTTTNQHQTTVNAKRNIAEPFLDLKLGFLLTESAMIYIKGGFNYTETSVKSQTDLLSTSTSALDPTVYSGNSTMASDNKDYKVGYRAGVGTEYMVTSKISLAIDYIYTFYPTRDTGTILGTGQSTFCDIEGCVVTEANTANASRSRLSDQQIVAQLVYHFTPCCN